MGSTYTFYINKQPGGFSGNIGNGQLFRKLLFFLIYTKIMTTFFFFFFVCLFFSSKEPAAVGSLRWACWRLRLTVS